MLLQKGVPKKCIKCSGEHPCWSAISMKLLCNFIETTLWHGCSPENLLYIFRTLFPKNTSGGLLLLITLWKFRFLNTSNYNSLTSNINFRLDCALCKISGSLHWGLILILCWFLLVYIYNFGGCINQTLIISPIQVWGGGIKIPQPVFLL